MGKRKWKAQRDDKPELRLDNEAGRIAEAIEAARRRDEQLARQYRSSESYQDER
jgi:hypothetical protein